MKYRTICSLVFVTLLMMGFQPMSQAEAAGKPFMLATAGTGGTAYVVGGAMADIMRRYGDTKVTPMTTNGYIENCRLVAGKRCAIGFSNVDVVYYAYHGMEMFKTGGKLQNLRYLAGGMTMALPIVVPKNSPVKRISDLRGKRVGVGAPGSSVYPLSVDVLAIGGLKTTDIKQAFLSLTEMTEALQDGTIDGAVYAGTTPSSAVMNIFATKEMRLLPYGEEEINAWLNKQGPEKRAFYSPYIVPANSYRGQTEAAPCLQFRGCLIAHTETPEETVYTFLKTINAQLAELGKVHPAGLQFTMENMVKGAAIPLHPGAEKFFKEKGVKVEMVK
jgi:hypothetical protein